MCEGCDEFPAQFVAYFNKAGGKFWRPAQKAPTAWAIDIRPPEPVETTCFRCEEPAEQSVPEEGA